MKTQSFVLSIICIFFFNAIGFAQTKKENIKVWGNCGMCKKTIETAATGAGATTAVWNEETKMLALTFNAKKTDAEKIQQAVAAAGYDTKDFTANDEAYKKLPGCCHYDRKSGAQAGEQQKMTCCKDGKCEKAECKDGCTDACKEACKNSTCCKDKSCCKS